MPQEKPRPLTMKEQAAIRALERLASKWPESLWLFSASGTLCVMKKNDEGERADVAGRDGGVDPRFEVATIDIPNDGGDW